MEGKRASSFWVLFAFLIGYLCYGFLCGLSSRDAGNMHYEIFRIKERKADSVKSAPRILLAGGSNVVWSYRSQVIEEELKIPTINLAINNEGGDTRVLQELVIRATRPNDIVLYSSVIFWGDYPVDRKAAQAFAEAAGLTRTNHWKDVLKWYWQPFPQDRPLIELLGGLYQRYWRQAPPPDFSAYYNSYGDAKWCYPKKIKPVSFVRPGHAEKLYSILFQFSDRIKAKKAKLILKFPWIYIEEAEREKWLEAYQPIFDRLNKDFSLQTPSLNYVLRSEREFFCDTTFHLDEATAKERSGMVAERLKEFLMQASLKP